MGAGHPNRSRQNRVVTAFIPNSEAPTATGVEFLGVDFQGNIYAGEVGRQRLVKYVRVRPQEPRLNVKTGSDTQSQMDNELLWYFQVPAQLPQDVQAGGDRGLPGHVDDIGTDRLEDV